MLFLVVWISADRIRIIYLNFYTKYEYFLNAAGSVKAILNVAAFQAFS